MKQANFVWILVCFVYLLFIFVFSFLYPYGPDELASINSKYFTEMLKLSVNVFLTISPKIGVFFSLIILYLGKWSFLILNPLVNLLLIFSTFFFIYLRKPDFNSLKDISVFILIAILSVYGVASPNETLFWIGGAAAYNWTFAVFLLILCAIRALLVKKYLFKDNAFARVIFLFFGLIAGMSNENTGPMALLIFTACFFYMRAKRIKIPKWYYFLFIGAVLGVYIMFFASPAHKIRMEYSPLYSKINPPSIWQKMFFHINHLDKFIRGTLLIPVFNFFALLICVLDKKKLILKRNDYILALFCFLVSCGLFFVLFAVPYHMRLYYSASFFSILAFIAVLKYISYTYKFNITKYVSALAFSAALIITPLFTIPYIALYKADIERDNTIQKAKLRGQEYAVIPIFLIVSGPTENLTIQFYDPANSLSINVREIWLKYKTIPIAPVPAWDSGDMLSNVI
ncbi:MAG: DUF6056 family protein [Elusimicrobiota bacterium]|jgi:hypothetical protein|nr:DUF6056 family protein [Elusimicrobiota bacterium]